MKIFVDTANLKDIEKALKRGFIDGVTTNPSLLAKEPKTQFEKHIGKIVELIKKYKDGVHLSVEVFSQDPKEILKQAKRFIKTFEYDSLSIKVQVGWNELEVITELAKENIFVNCTACMTISQAMLAAKAGARYASLFWGRIRDGLPETILEKIKKLEKTDPHDQDKLDILRGHLNEANRLLVFDRILEKADFNPFSVVKRTREIFDRENFNCEIIVGSMRSIWDVRDAMIAGAHIVTVPPKFFREFPKMAQHFKTDEVVEQFLNDFKGWIK